MREIHVIFILVPQQQPVSFLQEILFMLVNVVESTGQQFQVCVCICVYIHVSSNNICLNVIARLHAWRGGRRGKGGGGREEWGGGGGGERTRGVGDNSPIMFALEQIPTADGVRSILVVYTGQRKINVTNSTCQHYVIYVTGYRKTDHFADKIILKYVP